MLMKKHWRRCIAKKCVSPTESQSMAQFAVTSLCLHIQWYNEAMQETEVIVQRISQRCHFIGGITDDVQK